MTEIQLKTHDSSLLDTVDIGVFCVIFKSIRECTIIGKRSNPKNFGAVKKRMEENYEVQETYF